MPKAFDFGGVNLTAGDDSSGAKPAPETPFCIAILGDFSGRAHRGISDAKTISQRRPVLIDRDNFDEVLSRSGAEIAVPLGDGTLRLKFSELEDFHPDRIFQQLQAFSKLRELRGRLQDPSTFREAADELGLPASHSVSAREPESSREDAPDPARLASGSLLDNMIEQTESRIAEGLSKPKSDEVRQFAQRVATPYLVTTPDPRQSRVLSVIDRGIEALMRAVLHNHNFQQLEAIWRAIFLLVRGVETGAQLKIYLIDVSRDELDADLKAASDVRNTGAYRLLVEQSVETLGAEPWALIVGVTSFGGQEGEADVLSGMATICHRAGAPFLAEANASLLGSDSLVSDSHPQEWKVAREFSDQWAELRRRPEASSIGLAVPRFLLRLPYGKKTSPLESFDFEEFPDAPGHEDYLWGNPALALALLLAQSFTEGGWKMRPGNVTELAGLPLHTFATQGGVESKPCAEILLSEDAIERLLEQGLIPLVSVKNRDVVRVARFQSIAEPPRPLMGRWSR